MGLKLLVPGLADAWVQILKMLFFRSYACCDPLVGVEVSVMLAFFEYVGAFTLENLSQMFQETLNGLVRRNLLKGHGEGVVNQSSHIFIFANQTDLAFIIHHAVGDLDAVTAPVIKYHGIYG